MKPAAAAALLVLLLGGCAPENGMVVFAAASLSGLMENAAQAWGGAVRVHAAGSSALRAQLRRGARADLMIGADRESVAGLGGSPIPLWRNELVVVVPTSGPPGRAIAAPTDLVGLDCLAVADPDLAPAGRYARDALRRAGLWERLARVATGAPDVRAALAQVASGACPAGVVYRTDARAAARSVRVAFRLEGSRPVVYYAVVPAGSLRPKEAGEFLGFLRGERGKALARRYGLEPWRAPS